MAETKCTQRVCDRLSGFLNEAGAATRTHGGHDVDRGDARQPSKPDHESQRQVWIVRLAQNNQRQLSPETIPRRGGLDSEALRAMRPGQSARKSESVVATPA